METPTKKNRFGAVGRLGGQVKRLGSGMKKQTMKTAGAVWSVGTGGSSGAGNGGDGHGFESGCDHYAFARGGTFNRRNRRNSPGRAGCHRTVGRMGEISRSIMVGNRDPGAHPGGNAGS